MSTQTLGVIVASTRPGRIGRTIGDWFSEQARAYGGVDVRLLDLAEIALPFYDEPEHPASGRYVHQHTKQWSAAIDACAAIVLVMPEYNFTFSAPLKNAIDMLKREWKYKPVSFVSYGGVSGGLRAVESIKPLLVAQGMFPVGPGVSIRLPEYLDAQGQLVADDKLVAAADDTIAELIKVGDVMARLREPVAAEQLSA